MAGRVRIVINASLTQAVYMEPALNPGSVSVTLTGADNSVIKVSTLSFQLNLSLHLLPNIQNT